MRLPVVDRQIGGIGTIEGELEGLLFCGEANRLSAWHFDDRPLAAIVIDCSVHKWKRKGRALQEVCRYSPKAYVPAGAPLG